MKSFKRLDRSTFWMWAVPLLIAHVLLNVVTLSGGQGLGGLDTVVILWLAFRLAGRFYDIGWPAWTGPLFMIATMLVFPLAFVGYAIASHLPPADFMRELNMISGIVGLANLLLIIVAGSVPGRATADAPQVPPGVALPVSEPRRIAEPPRGEPQPKALVTSSSPVEERYVSKTDIFVIAAGGVLMIVVVGLFVAHVLPGSRSNPVAPPPSQVRLNNQQAEGNGLTKETNDYLRQLSKQPPAWLKDSAPRR
jgi:hypothetical protein